MSNAHDFNSLLSESPFQGFNLVAKYNVKGKYQFPEHYAGPFGDDIKSPWLSRSEVFELYTRLNNKWCDLHCSLRDLRSEYDISNVQNSFFYEDMRPVSSLRRLTSILLPDFIKKILKKYVFKQ